MRVTAAVTTLALRETFTIATGSADTEDVAVVTLEHDGVVAYGEGAPVDYWGESAGAIAAAVEADGPALLGDDLFAVQRIAERLVAWDGPQGAKMALDGALHDWIGKTVGRPVWRLVGTDRVTPPTSYTIGIDTVEGTARRARAAQGFEVLKVKVGGAADLERLEAIRELTDPRLPVLIDEGCRDLRSVAPIAAYADGIVIKISKCGGIHEAVRMVAAARALGLRVMLGCMIESELGIAQAAQLASLVDHVDLDGHLLISSRPFTGLGLQDGRLVLADAPGL